ncbi:helix-turn-helix domain-containing protein [Staphylococcus sp. ACRSN]|uniref:transcriptional regulator AryK n=1 Tax=Staphylococcus sp. ACRSN TaxID=2918214 RepID=UPI001EF28010|nr:helix-turn-helix domain-containing protein [Staphylococcus sp. ACRSN]MCG7339030.1 helix-turn-helix domain-containing protein [Staphylococcus sp. ACRSN]
MNYEYNIGFNRKVHLRKRVNEGLLIGLVLHGSMMIEKDYEALLFRKGEIFIINHNEVYLFKEFETTYYITIHLPKKYLQLLLTEAILKFYVLDRQRLQRTTYQQLIHIIAKLGTIFIRKGRFHKLYIEQLIIDLLFIIGRYIPTVEEDLPLLIETDQRILAICEYIEQNYNESITLYQIAEKFDVSVSYLSRKFKQQIGIGFTQYVNQIRLENAKEDLLHTKLTVTQIAFKNGFNTSNSLIKYFKKDMDQTPSMYRRKSQKLLHKRSGDKVEEPLNYQKYLYYLSFFINQNIEHINQPSENQKVINISLEHLDKRLEPMKQIIQIGSLEHLLVERYKKQLNEIKVHIGIDHILIKDPIKVGRLNQDYMESDENIPNIHPYMHIDESLNYLLMHKIGLGIELVPPQSLVRFESYLKDLKQLVIHLCNAFTKHEGLVLTIYIQCAHKHQFLEIKQLFGDYFVEVRFILNLPFLKDNQLEHYIEDYIGMIDGIAFSANQNDVIDFQSLEGTQFDTAKNYISKQIQFIKQIIDSNGKSLSLTLLNWNTLTGNTNLTNGEYFRAGIIFEQLLQINQSIDCVGYWLNYEIHQSFNKEQKPSQVIGIDLYHQFDGKRPAFFTAMFYKKLFSRILFQNDYCIVVGERTHFQIVIWDAEHYNPYFIVNKQKRNSDKSEYQIELNNVISGKYKVKHFTLDKNHGALYKVWQQYNTSHGMDKETIDYVNRVTYPKLKVSEIKINSNFTYQIKLTTNAIQIIEFNKYIESI